MQSQLGEPSVLSGDIPPISGAYMPRNETEAALAELPGAHTFVLVPAQDLAIAAGSAGGVGTTTLASAYAQACRRNGAAELVVWISATGRDAVLSGYAQALRDLRLAQDKDATAEHLAARFQDWLTKSGRPWLVVLDDLADAAAVDGLWPAGTAGRVLVTARRADIVAAAPRARLIGVGAFSPHEALDYIVTSLPADPGQRAGAPDLAAELRFGPLALSLACAFMARTGLGCREYRARFAERASAMANAFSGDLGLVATAWSLSLDLADSMPPRGLAWRMLTLISALSPHGIPGGVLTSEAARGYLAGARDGPADPAEMRAGLRNLAAAGLVAVDEHSPARTIHVHEILQLITRQHLSQADGQFAAMTAADALAQEWSRGEPPPAVAQALRDCTAKLSEIAGQFLWSPRFHPVVIQAGQSLDTEGLAGPAAGYWQAMLNVSQRVAGPDSPQTLTIRELLGSACEAAGRIDDAIAIATQSLAETEQQLGPGHPDAQRARQRLIRRYVASGRKAEAIRLADQVLARRTQSLGSDHADTLAAQADLAAMCVEMGELSDATAAYERVLAASERALGQQHSATIAIRVGLAAAYRKSGRLKEAVRLGRRVLADREAAAGPGHLDTISARAALAAAYRDAKKFKDALDLYERVLADRERIQGPDHPDTILARCDLALSQLATRKFGLAIPQYERALADSERVHGPQHATTEAVREALKEAADFARGALGIELRKDAR